MARVKNFYNRKMWQQTREAYIKSVGRLCERCRAKGLIVPAEIVHHKVHLNEMNVMNESIAYGFDNLEALCRSCHAEEHEEEYTERRREHGRYYFDKNGNVIIKGH